MLEDHLEQMMMPTCAIWEEIRKAGKLQQKAQGKKKNSKEVIIESLVAYP